MEFRDSRPNRQGVQDQLRTAIRRASDLVEGLDREQANRRPERGGWSVLECLDHLNVSARVYLPVFADAIEDARERGLVGGTGDGRTWLGRIIAWSQEPPVRMRFTTFEELLPGSDLEPADVLDEFEALHEELIVRINESLELDRRRIRVRSVLRPVLRMSLEDWYRFMAAHARRHLWQAARVRREVLAGPAAGGGGASEERAGSQDGSPDGSPDASSDGPRREGST